MINITRYKIDIQGVFFIVKCQTQNKSRMRTSSIRSSAVKKKKFVENWETVAPPQTKVEQYKYLDNCSKWIRTRMDQDRIPHLVRLHSTRVSSYDEASKVLPLSPEQSEPLTFNRTSYDYLPVHPLIYLLCPFCQQSIPSTQVPFALKNHYTSSSWTPLCAKCYQGIQNSGLHSSSVVVTSSSLSGSSSSSSSVSCSGSSSISGSCSTAESSHSVKEC